MKSGCSLSWATASCWSLAESTTSCHQTSRSSFHATSSLVRCTTRTFSTVLSPSTAASTAGLSGAVLPRRNWPSAVMTSLASASAMRVRRASAEKPPNTTEWGAPIRAQASMAATASGIIGR